MIRRSPGSDEHTVCLPLPLPGSIRSAKRRLYLTLRPNFGYQRLGVPSAADVQEFPAITLLGFIAFRCESAPSIVNY